MDSGRGCGRVWLLLGAVVMMHRLLIRPAAFEAFRMLYSYLLRALGPAVTAVVFRHLPQVADLALGFCFRWVI